MKETLVATMALAICLTLCGCGNMGIGLGSFTFEKVHVDTHNYSGCFSVKKWYECETGIEVDTVEVGAFFLSEGTYILLEGKTECPFCAVGGCGNG